MQQVAWQWIADILLEGLQQVRSFYYHKGWCEISGTAYEIKENLRMKQEETSGRSNGILHGIMILSWYFFTMILFLFSGNNRNETILHAKQVISVHLRICRVVGLIS
jgi:hypothetical protein